MRLSGKLPGAISSRSTESVSKPVPSHSRVRVLAESEDTDEEQRQHDQQSGRSRWSGERRTG